MGGGELVQPLLAAGGEPDAGEPTVAVVVLPFHQPGRLGPVDELGSAVRAEHQVAGQVTDGGAVRPGVALDGEQQLMLGRSKPGRPGLRLGPVQETAQPGPEGEQVLVVLAGQLVPPARRPGGGIRMGGRASRDPGGIAAGSGLVPAGGPAGGNGAALGSGFSGLHATSRDRGRRGLPR